MPAPKNSPNEPAPDQLLIEMARQYARRVTGQDLEHITLALANGTKHIIDLSSGAGEWPPEEGWALRGDRAARNGETFRLTGKPRAVFAALVESGDAGLTLLELKRAVWDEHAENRTAQNMISKLRQLVRDRLSLSEVEEPIEIDGDRYRLAVA